MARRNAELDAVVHELETAEVDYRIEQRKRHLAVSWNHNGKADRVIVSNSASDHRAITNARCEVRRKLRSARHG